LVSHLTRVAYGHLPAFELLHLPHKAAGVGWQETLPLLARELLHLPHKAAGVAWQGTLPLLARELLHLPDKPAGIHL